MEPRLTPLRRQPDFIGRDEVHGRIWAVEAKSCTGCICSSPISLYQSQPYDFGASNSRANLLRLGWIKVQPRLLASGTVDRFGKESAGESKREFEKFMLSSAMAGLRQRNITRLIRIVRDWAANSEEAAEPIISRNAFSSAQEHFHAAVHEANHPLLVRDVEKKAWAWFSWWRSLALVGLDRGVSGRTMLELLKLTAEVLRRCSLFPAPPTRLAISERLERLADTIVGHAPPPILAPDDLPAEAG